MPVSSVGPVLRDQQCHDCNAEPIVIGLVNNMPDTALRTTERQFRELIAAASNNVEVRLRLFSLPQLPRSHAARSYLDPHYEDISELWTGQFDGMIVTGTEPRAPSLTDEPYWRTLAKLVDWAEDHTISTIWSCLAAHAAVLQRDGLVRHAVGEKLFGVFDCVKAADHAIVLDAPPRWRVPHSRYNGLPKEGLVSRGYQILSWSAEAGVDMFVAQRKSLFIFLQGHPEYDPGALFREYRRDIRRFLIGQRDNYPVMPRGYFDAETAAVFSAFQERAVRNQEIDLLSGFPDVTEAKLPHSWRRLAMRIYANWLSYLIEQRSRKHRPLEAEAFRRGQGV